MLYLVLSLIAIVIVTAAIGYFSYGKDGDDTIVPPIANCATCTGENDKCELDCKLEAATKEIEYFDDEELDAYKGRAAESYSDEEIGDFEYVLETMKPHEVADWCRSLVMRGINLPEQVRDEAIMIINDTRK